ncbi:hypothetical protein N7509_007692 [Penicillium cosmopolitanum]|uniref:Protein kinase domain-containing protein n=1 Tax=Penicillium cosmopolitanum TaxID=1131564 RepID=A0A9W9VZC5_9EURO|nr:uncharacterized protein N7509_007692 [Penicillium cosmopolitanum]KAJ5392202.1 hypothetical protein N7509_007692 [Penicillium cosmopolitanum]
MGPEWLVKIGDFGMSKRINENSSLRTIRGTQAFLAPEMQGILPPEEEEEASLNYHYTESVDMWALGVTIFYLLFRDYPFTLKQPSKLPRYIWGANFPFPISPSQKLSQECCSFIEAVMARNARERLSARKALESDWLMQCYSSPAPSPSASPSPETTVLNIPARESSRHTSFSIERPDSSSTWLAHGAGGDIYFDSEAIINPEPDRSPDFDITTGISRVTAAPPSVDTSQISQSPSSRHQEITPTDVISSTNNPITVVPSLQNKMKEASLVKRFSWESLSMETLSGESDNDETRAKLHDLQAQGMKMLKENNYDQAENLLQQVLNVREQIFGTKHEATLEVYHTLGALWYKRMQHSTAHTLFALAAHGRKETIGPKHPDTLSSFYWLGDTKSELGLFEEAELVLKQNAEDRASTIGFNNPKTLQTNHMLGLSLWAQQKWNEAISVLGPVAEKRRDTLGETHPDTVSSIFWTGYSFYKLGLYEKALVVLEEAAAIQKISLGSSNEETVRTISVIGRSLYHLERWEKARAVLQEAASLNQLPKPTGTTLHVLYLLGRSLLYLKRYEEASRALQEAAEGQKRVLGPTHPETLWSLYRLGRSFQYLDRFVEAEAAFQQAVKGGAETFGQDHPETLSSVYRLGVSQYKLKLFDEAKDSLQQAVKGQLKTLGPNDMNTLDSQFWLGCSLYSLKLYDQAEATYRETLAREIEVYGRARSSTLASIDSLVWAYYRDESYLKAEKLAELLVERSMETNGPMDTRTLQAKRILALTLQEEGHMERASLLHSEVLHYRFEALGAQHKDTCQSSWELGKCHSEMSEIERMRVDERMSVDERMRVNNIRYLSRGYYSTEALRESPAEEGKNEKRNWTDAWTRVKRRMSKADGIF